MKRFGLILCVLVMCGLGFSGCANYNGEKEQDYPWSVILIMKYDLKTETAPADALDQIKAQINPIMGENEYSVWQSGTVVQIEMYFENYSAFAEMFHVEQIAQVKVSTSEKLFFIERTIKFQNPIKDIKDKKTLNDVDTKVKTAYGDYLTLNPYGLYFVLESPTRRTKIETSYKHENVGLHYMYYFRNDVDQIEIFDRYANQPIWYVIGLGGTFVFMGLIWLYFKSKKRTIDAWRSQSFPTSTAI